MKIYVASSWRNEHLDIVVGALRNRQHEVYDFRSPKPGNNGFRWSDIDPAWTNQTRISASALASGLSHPIAKAGFALDYESLRWAEVCVLVLPCGKSAHLEAGWMMGQQKPTFVYAPDGLEPELMYLLGGNCICSSLDHLCARLDSSDELRSLR